MKRMRHLAKHRVVSSNLVVLAFVAVALLSFSSAPSSGVSAQESLAPIHAGAAYAVAQKAALDWDRTAQFVEMSSVGKSSLKTETQAFANLEQVA